MPGNTSQLVYGKQVTVGGMRVKSGQPLVLRDGTATAIIDITSHGRPTRRVLPPKRRRDRRL